jgi:hypothetical protein
MAKRDILTNEMIRNAVTKVVTNSFTTIELIEILEDIEPIIISKLKSKIRRNWRAEIGKAISRYEVETNKINKKLPPSKKQARWEKKNY